MKPRPHYLSVRFIKLARSAGAWSFMLFFLLFSSLASARECIELREVHHIPNGDYLSSVAYHDGQWLAVGGRTVLSSTNGMDWFSLDANFDGFFVDVVWAGDRFALLGRSVSPRKPTLVSWTPSGGFIEYPSFFSYGTPFSLGWNGIDTLIIGYYHSLFEFTFFATTNDYITPASNVEIGSNCGVTRDMDLVNGLSVVGIECQDLSGIGYRAMVKYSYDGLRYHSESFGPFESFGADGLATNGATTFVNGIYYPPGSNDTLYLFSHTPNLGTVPIKTYQDTVETFRHRMVDADWVDPLFVGVDPEGKIGFSPDGLQWQEVAHEYKVSLRRIIPTTPHHFVAVGEGATILHGQIFSNQSRLEDWPSVDCIELMLSLAACGTL